MHPAVQGEKLELPPALLIPRAQRAVEQGLQARPLALVERVARRGEARDRGAGGELRRGAQQRVGVRPLVGQRVQEELGEGDGVEILDGAPLDIQHLLDGTPAPRKVPVAPRAVGKEPQARSPRQQGLLELHPGGPGPEETVLPERIVLVRLDVVDIHGPRRRAEKHRRHPALGRGRARALQEIREGRRRLPLAAERAHLLDVGPGLPRAHGPAGSSTGGSSSRASASSSTRPPGASPCSWACSASMASSTVDRVC